MAGEWARAPELEAEPLCRRRIRPLMFLGGVGDLRKSGSRRARGRMDTGVRRGGRTALPPLRSASNVSSEDGKW